MSRPQYFQTARAQLDMCCMLIEYTCVNLRITGVSGRVLVVLRAEVSFWEMMWAHWDDAVRFGPWDIV